MQSGSRVEIGRLCSLRILSAKRHYADVTSVLLTVDPGYKVIWRGVRGDRNRVLKAGVGEVKLLTILLYGDLCSWSLNTAPYVSTLLILQHTK